MERRLVSGKCLFSFTIALLFVFSYEASAQNCCEKLRIRTDCYFLCGTGSTWKSLLNFKCYSDYGAEVVKCKVSSATDYVKLFGHRFSQTVQKGYQKLSATVQQKLADISSFASASISELQSVPQDVLAKLSTLQGMTRDQLRGLTSRLKDFTTQNLRSFVKTVKADVLFENMKELGKQKWDLEQAQVFIDAAYRKYGPDVKRWTGEQLKSLGSIIKAMPYEDLAKISATAFDSSLEAICRATLSLDQKASVLVSAESAFGGISRWKSNQLIRLCDSVDAMTPEDIMKLSAKTVQDSYSFLRTKVWERPQVQALFRKSKEVYGEVRTWGGDQLKMLGNIVSGMEPDEIVQLSASAVKDALADLGQIDWNAAQLEKIAAKLKEGLGSLNTWRQNDLMKAKRILAGLTPSELNQIQASEIVASIHELKNVKWTPEQALVILKKVKSMVPIPSLTKDQVISLGNVLQNVASSEVGQFGRGILTAAFPQIKHVEGIATPVLRRFVEEYKKSGNTKDLSLLGGIAVAMTRVDLSETDISDILASVEKLSGVDWDEAQIAELIQKARKQLGDLKKTDDTDTDSPPWGFKNLERLGKVVLGLTKDELKSFPIRGIEDGVEALGKQLGWKRGQVLAITERMREYLQTDNKTLADLKEAELESLGTFLQGLTLAELKKLPDSVTVAVIQKLGEQTGLPEDKLRSRAFWAFNILKQKANGVLNSKEVRTLGNLVSGLGMEAWRSVSKDGFKQYVEKIVRTPGFRKENFRDIIGWAKRNFDESDVGKWTGSAWRKISPAIVSMDASEIYRISKEAFSNAIGELGKVTGFSTEQAEALIIRAKEYWKASDVAMWTGQQLRSLGTIIKGLRVEEIKRITKAALSDIMGDCSRFDNVEKSRMKAFADRAKQVFGSGSISSMSSSDLRKMWCLLTGLDAKDLEKMRLDIDLVDRLGNLTGWDSDQLLALKNKVKSYFHSNPNENSLMSLGNILKAYIPDEIKAFPSEAFKFAAGKLGKIDGLSKEQLMALADKAKEAWGDVGTWTKAQIAESGNFLAGLKTLDISKIQPFEVDAIKPKAIKMMNLNEIQAFSEAQLSAMEQSQTVMISANTRNQLSAPKVAALRSVEQKDPEDENPWCTGSSCNSGLQVQFSCATIVLSLVSMVISLWALH